MGYKDASAWKKLLRGNPIDWKKEGWFCFTTLKMPSTRHFPTFDWSQRTLPLAS